MVDISASLYNLPLLEEDSIMGIAKLDYKKDDKSLSDCPLDEVLTFYTFHLLNSMIEFI